MINVLRPAARERLGPAGAGSSAAASPACRSTTSASSTASRRSRAGRSPPAQFVDLNAKIGGVDDRHRARPRRASRPTEPALAQRLPQRRRSTRPTTSTRSRSSTCAGPTRAPSTTPTAPGRSARGSSASTGTSRQPRDLVRPRRRCIGDPTTTTEGLIAMDRWLAAVEADDSDKPLAEKIVDDRPADIQDTLLGTSPGVEAVDVPGLGAVCEHEPLQTRYGTPRTVAGECDRHRHQQVHAQAAAAQRLLPGRLHRRPVGAAAGGLPDRRLRLVEARRRPAGRDPVADLPGRRRRRASTAAGRSARLPRARVALGPARRSRAGSPPSPVGRRRRRSPSR